MDRFAKGFVVMSIIYLGISTVMGIVMLGHQNLLAIKFVHSHLNMLGWVSMMIYGVGYHILPRFMGRPLYSARIAGWHFYLANVGLLGMLFFYVLNVYAASSAYQSLMMASSILEAISIVLFLYNMLMTLMPGVQTEG